MVLFSKLQRPESSKQQLERYEYGPNEKKFADKSKTHIKPSFDYGAMVNTVNRAPKRKAPPRPKAPKKAPKKKPTRKPREAASGRSWSRDSFPTDTPPR